MFLCSCVLGHPGSTLRTACGVPLTDVGHHAVAICERRWALGTGVFEASIHKDSFLLNLVLHGPGNKCRTESKPGELKKKVACLSFLFVFSLEK